MIDAIQPNYPYKEVIESIFSFFSQKTCVMCPYGNKATDNYNDFIEITCHLTEKFVLAITGSEFKSKDEIEEMAKLLELIIYLA